jgi:RNA polymerase sigma-70 factor (ECF subfamily)
MKPMDMPDYGIRGDMADLVADGGLKQLYTLHRPELLRFLTARTGDREDAEDVIQELWIKLETVPGGPVANGRAYLYRMAQNLVLDRVRERRRRERREQNWTTQETGVAPNGGEVADAAPNAEDLLAERDEIARIASAIANLPEGARRTFRLHKIEGLSHGEVAERLGISRSGVEKHMAVAMKYLRRALMD